MTHSVPGIQPLSWRILKDDTARANEITTPVPLACY